MNEKDDNGAPKWPENLTRLSEYLFKNSQIGTIRLSRQRYVNLRTQNMFDSLVNLYAQMFMAQWEHYETFMKSFPPPSGVPPHIYAARSYISIWFVDLYASIRKAVRKTAFIDQYQEELFQFSHEYDKYLTLLNASIRPTHVKNALDDAQYIPIIADSINVNDPNPFRINNFTPEKKLFHGFIQIMKTKSPWQFSRLSSDENGRPCWLFDWHAKNRVCSWFPPEDNYNVEDFTLAYILGTACSPNLGGRDVDDWQCFDEGIVPRNPNPKDYNRVAERRFYGSYEVRTMEIETEFSPPTIGDQVNSNILSERGTRPTKKPRMKGPSSDSASCEEAQEVDRMVPRFKLIDWVYHHKIVVEIDTHKRTGVLGSFSLV